MSDLVLEKQEFGIPRTKWDILDKPTPKWKIKKRRGRDNMVFDYVDTGYVVKKLDEVFHKAWDFEIVDKQVGDGHVWVLGKLTIKFLDNNGNIQTITKMQFGGSDVKKAKHSGEIIDIADDLKSAASDSLKKCASLLGVAADVYFKEKNQESAKVRAEGDCQHKWDLKTSSKGRAYKTCSICGKFEWHV